MDGKKPKPPSPKIEALKGKALASAESFSKPKFELMQKFAERISRNPRGTKIMDFTIKHEYTAFELKSKNSEEALQNTLEVIGGEFLIRLVSDQIFQISRLSSTANNPEFPETFPYDGSMIPILVPQEDEPDTHEDFGYPKKLTPANLVEIFTNATNKIFPDENDLHRKAMSDMIQDALTAYDHGFDPDDAAYSHEFLHDYLIPEIVEGGDFFWLSFANSKKNLPQSLKTENVKFRSSILDRSVEKFLDDLQYNKDEVTAPPTQQRFYYAVYSEGNFDHRWQVNQEMKVNLGGIIISDLILSKIQKDAKEMNDQDLQLEEVYDDLRDLSTLEKLVGDISIVGEIDLSDEEHAGIIEELLIMFFSSAISQVFGASDKKFLREILSVTEDAIRDYFMSNPSNDNFLECVDGVFHAIEDIGNRIFLNTYTTIRNTKTEGH